MATTPIALRPVAAVNAVYERLQRELPRIAEVAGARGEGYTRGKLEALGWVLRRAELSPLTNRAGVDLSDPWAITREQIHATEMLQGMRERDRRGTAYISGVEVALMWVLRQTESSL